ncbi:hypothetical protein K432DRAFT_406432, partial [Lepidopterella palustris CBS 459.81]
MPSIADVDAPRNDIKTPTSHMRRKSKEGQIPVNNYPAEKPYCVAIPEAPLTGSRVPYIPQKNDSLIDAGAARATVAASSQSPNGTVENDWAREHQHQT